MSLSKGGLTIDNEKFEFSGLGMIMSLVLLVFSFSLVHGYWLGEPFESWLSIFVTLYLLVCTWAFPYLAKELSRRFENGSQRTGFTIFQGMIIVVYFVAPFIYIYLKYFETEDDEETGKTQSKKTQFSRRGLIMGSFFFFLLLPLLHIEWIGPFFGSVISILVSIYLGVCIWTFSNTFKELEHTIDFFLDKPLGRIMLPFVYLILYVLSPFIYIRLRFLNNN